MVAMVLPSDEYLALATTLLDSLTGDPNGVSFPLTTSTHWLMLASGRDGSPSASSSLRANAHLFSPARRQEGG